MSNFISNAFQVPNAVIDELMANLSPNSLKCYLLIVRQTTGWGKVSDRISESQFMDKTGIKNVKTVRVALAELVDLGLINQDKSRGQITEYSLVLDSKNQCQKTVVPKNGTSTKKRTEVVPKIGSKPVPKIGTLQKTITKTTNTKEKNTQKNCSLELCFEQFWKAYPTKANKQGAMKSFKAALKKQNLTASEFTDMLVSDVSERIKRKQFGFDKLHATTYLNNERWSDPHEENQPRAIESGYKPNSIDAYNERLLAKYGHASAPIEREINPIDGSGLG
ncbi:replication protein [Vibrio fluvialis]|uniref:replication protein n=1 Tax=Vibrio fluvialis TaxID=676 RepID=UPI00192ADC6B|nr:replication protein [Vibrio fluvialis]MBL4278822.1 replication protein [Vibrio fluvialis]